MRARCETCGCFMKRRTTRHEGHEIVWDECKNSACDPYDGWVG